MNPYVGHPNPMQEGQELFRKGLLSEAVLALEAEVLKNPDNAEGWRLLGVTHAENDDDQQVMYLPLMFIFFLYVNYAIIYYVDKVQHVSTGVWVLFVMSFE